MQRILRVFLVLFPCVLTGLLAQNDAVELDVYSPELASQLQAVPYQQELMVHGLTLGASFAAESLSLRRFDVFEDGARVFVHGDQGTEIVAPPRHHYFRGEIQGLTGSRAFLSVREDGRVSGLVGHEGRYYRLEPPATRQPGEPVLAEIDLSAAPLPEEHGGFSCAADQLPDPADLDPEPAKQFQHPPARFSGIRGGNATYYASVGLATDYELFQKFDDVNHMMTYISDLFAYISAIYEAEVDTHLVIADTDVWTTANDPWQSTSTGCQLSEFGRYWSRNRADRPRTIAHFLSGKNSGGGVAWVGVLCRGPWMSNPNSSCPELGTERDLFGGPYGVSAGISDRFNVDNPVIVWDITVVAHEIGHNFNSGHTHCYGGIGGSEEPVDKCAGAGDCHDGPNELPCGTAGGGCGTIMSYCHIRGGGIRNIAPTFGMNHGFGVLPDRVPERMNAHVINRAANNPDCLPQACFSPSIDQSPVSTSACVGDTVELSVSQSFGSRYQWRRNGQTLAGQTNANLVLNVSGSETAGSYTCVVTNDCASVESDAAVVTLDPAFAAEIRQGTHIVQGLRPVRLDGAISCNREVSWTWQDVATGNVLGRDTLAFTMPFRYEETTSVQLRVQDVQTNAVVRAFIEVLVPSDTAFEDLNGDGCNTVADLRFLSQWWRTQRADANGDNFIDVRDFLYLNLDESTCE
ncbi:M12 family metallo-peptidase [Acanthopleuribacter pedis]|uniref:Ig-like domain-containing protein n=1 Tax=Acanthopleuribacter pedis TaxID=442870 RepID=A0A8J7QB34_9BACT|nr:M12 family metallo-peptidase [Acanthopleuribacter pedis]MBO1317591.1 hypothetical protein [Acanthopleuribacter pedis]